MAFKNIAAALIVSLILAVGCGASEKSMGKKEDKVADNKKVFSVDETLESAKTMLRMDDYKDFEKAEFRFIAVRLWKMEDPEIAGWLAQLYVAWTEQLKYEISFLRLKLEATKQIKNKEDIAALESIIEYRVKKMKEVEENAQQLCNLMKLYFPDNYLSHRVLADYYRIMGDEEQFRDRLLIVEQLNPKSNGLLFLKGAALDNFDNDHIAAIDYYDRALKNDPRFVKALYFEGLSYNKMGYESKAKETMEKVLELSPDHPGAKAYLSANEYVAQLTEQAKKALGGATKENAMVKKTPQLVYWVADWGEGGSPELKYRLAAPTEFDADVKLSISLVENSDKAIQTLTLLEKMKAGEFRTLVQNFYPPKKRKGFTYEIMVQVSAKPEGENEFKVVQVRKASLPKRK